MSGHAFRTLLLAAAIPWIWVLPPTRRRWVSYLLGAVVAAIGLALVYLGDHWASEVIGGYLLAWIGMALLQGFRSQHVEGTLPSAMRDTGSEA